MAVLLALPVAFAAVRAAADLPAWFSDAGSGSPAEAVLYRAMQLPGLSVLFPRPPAESVAELDKLIAAGAAKAELYALRARQNEAALRLPEAEADWKHFADASADKAAGLNALADFYGRRIEARPQFDTLLQVGAMPATPADRSVAPDTQTSWTAFEGALKVADEQLLEPAVVDGLWQRWTARYPDQPVAWARAVEWQIAHDRAAEAQTIVTQYKQRFPADPVLPLKATALIALKPVNGTTDLAGVNRALAVYDAAFQPDWPEDLVRSYMALLDATHNTRRFTADARARLERNPDDLNAAARLFFYQHQSGHNEAALAVLTAFRESREQRLSTSSGSTSNHSSSIISTHPWTANELQTLAGLAARAKGYPEAARFDFALASLPGALPDGRTARAAGLAGLTQALLDAPDQPIALGSGNMSLYRDIGQMDQGPGLWNGVLSLWLNGEQIPTEFDSEEAKAQPYFHRAKAAELVVLLDRDAPNAPERSALHAKLVDVYADYGDDAAVLHEGQAYLQAFAQDSDRTAVALQMAGAYERTRKDAEEFALYDRLLTELAGRTDHLPLTAAELAKHREQTSTLATSAETPADESGDASAIANSTSAIPTDTTVRPLTASAFALDTGAPQPPANPAATEYAQVLDRYLGRLTADKKLPEALAVLRKELDRNPDDPALYDKLSGFLEANNLAEQDEAIYRRAIDRFGGTGWQDKLARFYLRQKRSQDFAALTRRVVDTFSGSDLASYFAQVTTLESSGSGALAVELNVYAHKRFPHNALFTNNLLRLYKARGTADAAAHERLLRETWWQSPALTAQFFEMLSGKGELDAEIAKLGPAAADEATGNPAAAEERAEAAIWSSHFEEAAPGFTALAAVYPADTTQGTTAADLNRSLAWYDPAGTPGVPSAHIAAAVAIQQRMLEATPGDTALLEKIGDTLADHANGDPTSLLASERIWLREPGLAPGDPDHYLRAATVFWDYFQFDRAEAILAQARTRLKQPALYAYESGALAEGRRDDEAAVRDYVRGVVDPADGELDESSECSVRLQQLARRADMAKLVDTATLEAVNAANGSAPRIHIALSGGRSADANTSDRAYDSTATDSTNNKADEALSAALRLRVSILGTLNRQAEIGPLLLTAAKTAGALDGAAAIASFAQAQNQTAAREAALAREAELAQDPVERLELRYALASSLAERKDTAGAAAIVDAIDRENPNLLGVVRRTVDFDTNHDRKPAAVKRLLTAAAMARSPQPKLALQFTAEASAKANAAGDTTEGRRIALTLLADDPYNAQYLSLAADSYARANDPAGLRQFYLDRLKAVEAAQMTATERRDRTALLRRGLIPALNTGKDYPGAVDQYIALLSAFPEDAALNNEAALYALRYNRQTQWLGFLQQTTASSPRDARFFVDLAQSEQVFGEGPAAIEAYGRATSIRKDRADLYQAKASLEEALGRFDDAATDFARLYMLTYKDPQYMVAVARVRARQGRAALSVAALKTAYLSEPKPVAHDYFTVAAQLEVWHLLDDAGRFAEQGRTAAGADFMTAGGASTSAVDLVADETGDAGASVPQNDDDVATYARILTRLDRTSEVLATLRKGAVDAGAAGPNAVAAAKTPADGQNAAQDADAQGSDADAPTAADLRKAKLAEKAGAASGAYSRGLAAMGAAIHRYATPEGKAAYAAALTAEKARATPVEVRARWIDAAHNAGLAGLEADWRRAVLTAAPAGPANEQVNPLIQLERRREAFEELGQALLAGLRAHPKLNGNVAAEAAEAFRAAGDTPAELRAFTQVRMAANSQGPLRDRYLDLLLASDPNALAALAGGKSESLADAAANRAILGPTGGAAGGKPSMELIRTVLARRGASLSQAWRDNYLALAGLYTGDTSGDIDAAFRRVLQPDRTIGERLATKPDLNQELEGKPWFGLAQSYGEWRLLTPADRAAAEDVLPGQLEASADYRNMTVTYAEAGDTAAALKEIDHQIEASARAGAPDYDLKATLLWNSGRRPEAIAAWTAAFDELRTEEDEAAPPAEFWGQFAQLARRAHELGLYTELKAAMESVLRPYLHRNGTYRSNELLQAAFEAAPTPNGDTAEGTAWLLSLSSSSKQSADVLSDLDRAAWLPASAQAALLERELSLASSSGDGGSGPSSAVAIKTRLILLNTREHRDAEAQALLSGLPDAQRDDDLRWAEMVLAGRAGLQDALLARYTSAPEHAPSKTLIRRAASDLSHENLPQPARAMLEWSFLQSLASHSLETADYAALAEVRIHTGDTGGAVSLLKSLTQSGTDTDANLDHAAAVFEAAHLPAEAAAFLAPLVRDEPWNGAAKLRLAQTELAAHSPSNSNPVALLTALMHDPAVPYTLRAKAAATLGGQVRRMAAPSTAELNGNAAAATLRTAAWERQAAHPPSAAQVSPASRTARAATGTAAGSLSTRESAELTLLASGPVAPASARKPYFVASRRAAATNASPEEAANLLSETVAIAPSTPDDGALRLDLLRAQLRAGRAAAARATARFIAPNTGYYGGSLDYSTGTGENADVGAAGTDADPLNASGGQAGSSLNSANADWSNEDLNLRGAESRVLPAAALSLPRAQHAELLRDLARVYTQTGERSTAIADLRLCLRLEPTGPHAAEDQAAIETLVRQQRIDDANRWRQPVVTKNPDQSNTVRLHLTEPPRFGFDLGPGIPANGPSTEAQ